MVELDVRDYIELWWSVALRGALTMLVGFLAIIWPGPTLIVLVVLFGVTAIVGGVSALIIALSGRVNTNARWLAALEGGLGVVIGLVAFFYPRITITAVLVLIAFWAIFYGLLQITLAISLPSEVKHLWLLIASGLVAILIGIIFFVAPISAAKTITLLTGLAVLVIGAVTFAFSLRLRSLKNNVDRFTKEATPA